MTTFVDTNVLLDIATRNPMWSEPSLAAIARAHDIGTLVINDVVYAEFSVGLASVHDVDLALRAIGVERAPLPEEALFSAGKAFKRYRAAGGMRTGVLPDFFIGAHAETEGWPLLTRDPKRYRIYFQAVELVVPTP